MNLIRLSVNNPVAVTIAMFAVIFFGVYKCFTITREFFPQAELDRVVVRVPWPGATPSDVERGIIQKIERAVEGVKGVDEITSQAQENMGVLVVKVDSAADLKLVSDDIRKEIDTIPDLPEDAEEPIVEVLEQQVPCIALVVYGDATERQLKHTAEMIKDDLLASPYISRVLVTGVRQEEISIEVSPDRLEAYGLTFGEVGQAVRANNADLAGGEIKSPMGTILVRTLAEQTTGLPLEQILVRSDADGRAIRLGDVAAVRDGFEENALRGLFQVRREGSTENLSDGQRAVQVIAFKRGAEDAIRISDTVKAYILEKAPQLEGEAIKIAYRVDLARLIYERIDLMARNALQGLVLVFISLALFLNIRLAFWVGSGLVVAFLGTFIVMDLVGATINMLSLFGLIIVIGLIVDDAIVVAENVYSKMEDGMPRHLAAVEGAEEVVQPVLATVLTTVVAFAPLAFMQGVVGDFLAVIPVVVVAALVLSLVECFTLLPSHLAEFAGDPTRHKLVHTGDNWYHRSCTRLNQLRHEWLEVRMVAGYERVLRFCLHWRYVTLAAALCVCMTTMGLMAAGYLPFVLFQRIDSDTLVAELEMTNGTPAEKTEAALSRIVSAALEFPDVKSVYSVVGFREESEMQTQPDPAKIGEVIVELRDNQHRVMRSTEIINAWRDAVGVLPGSTVLKFRERAGGPGGPEIEVQVRGPNEATVAKAVRHVREVMNQYVGVRDIEDDSGAGKLEMRLRMKESARALGLTSDAIAQQVRGAFFGYEAQRLQRSNEELKIWVRLTEENRRAITDLLRLRIETPTGQRVPLEEVAHIDMERGVPAIRRVNGQRTTTVLADVDYALANTNEVTAGLVKDFEAIPTMFPGVKVSFEGAKKETAESIGSLAFGFPVALILIYCVLAVLFKSYVQPVMIMTAIPFGLFGAMLGHLIYGLLPGREALPITFLSLIGMVGLSGIVVNDSLILVDFINYSRRHNNVRLKEAIIIAGRRRLRPIILTSITTIFGLAPLLLETSFQAQFLIPMAVSISFGLALTTGLTLLVLPCLYMMLEDLRTFTYWLATGNWRVVQLVQDELVEKESREVALP